jgi:ribulose-phosphate 3-epimerase
MQISALELLDQAPALSVGVLSADLLRLGEELEELDQAGVSLVHIDVMDGVFCPMTTVGPPFVGAIPERFVKDVHLMVDEPLGKVEDYVEAGAGILVFHPESTRHPHRVLQTLAGTGVLRGVALNPGTPLSLVHPLLDDLELVLVLGVNPGWSGQSFIPSTERRIIKVRALLADRQTALAVDGGVTGANVERLASLGVDLIVAGSAVYRGGLPADNARALLEAARRGRAHEGEPAEGDAAVIAGGSDRDC